MCHREIQLPQKCRPESRPPEERTVTEMWIFLHRGHKEERKYLKQNKHKASSVQVQHLESVVADLQSQLQSQGTNISGIIGTVNDSLATNDDQRSGKIPATLPSGLGNADALALANATIASLQAQICQQANDLNYAYQVPKKSASGRSQEFDRGHGRGGKATGGQG